MSSYPSDVIEQGRAALEAWRSIDPAFKVGDLTPEALEADLAQIQPVLAQIDRLKADMIETRTQSETISLAIWDKVKRLRRTVQGTYGDDSPQYAVVGGTRIRDRKPVSKTPKTTS